MTPAQRRTTVTLFLVLALVTSSLLVSSTPATAQSPSTTAWRDLISFRPSQQIQESVRARRNGASAFVQPIEDGTDSLSLDEYTVRITQLPRNPATGRQYTPVELTEHIRTRLNEFIDPSLARFHIYSQRHPGNGDDNHWTTANPLGSVLSIDLLNFPTSLTRGSVVTSAHSLAADSPSWTLSTVYMPRDQYHPLSGNRQWGMRRDGSAWIFYTRAADRFSTGLYAAQPDAAYSRGDALWRSMQARVRDYVSTNGGAATVLQPFSRRYLWPGACQESWYPTVAWVGASTVRDASRCNGLSASYVPIGGRPGYSTGIMVQNPASQPANVRLSFIGSNGGTVSTVQRQVPAGGAESFVDAAPSGFDGAAIVVSDTVVTVAVNLINSQNGTMASTGTARAGAPELRLPLLKRRAFGNSTWFSVQATGSSGAQFQVRYFQNGQELTNARREYVLPPLAAMRLDQATNPALPEGFVGSAEIVATGPVAATVHEESGSALFGYSGQGLDESGTELVAPLIMSQHYGVFTGVQVQNVGTARTSVSVSFGDNVAQPEPGQLPPCSGRPATQYQGVDPGSSVTFVQLPSGNSSFTNCRYVGSATIRAGQPLLAVVNQAGPQTASAYEAPSRHLLTNTVRVPLLAANNFRVWSGMLIQNAGASTANFTLTYGGNIAQDVPNAQGFRPCTRLPAPRTLTIGAGSAAAVLQPQEPEFNGCMYVGSATITGSTGSRVVVAVNQQNPNLARDRISTYIAR